MRKRIGTKVYDTATSEEICSVEGGQLYRKRTRDREWFLVSGDNIEPLEDEDARAMSGNYADPEPESKDIMIRVDRETHARIAEIAKERGVTIGEVVKQLTALTV